MKFMNLEQNLQKSDFCKFRTLQEVDFLRRELLGIVFHTPKIDIAVFVII